MSPECMNCGHDVTKRYVAVFAPDGLDNPRCCPFCPDLVRTGSDIRETTSSRQQARGVD